MTTCQTGESGRYVVVGSDALLAAGRLRLDATVAFVDTAALQGLQEALLFFLHSCCSITACRR
jgi:hypothetical protein